MNLDDLELIWEEDEKSPDSLIKKLNQHELANEVAFHEASHLVFCHLIQKLNLGFSQIQSIQIVSDNEINGLCVGCGLIIEGYSWEKPYLDNPKCLFPKLLMLISGYISYLQFIENTEYFIGINSSQGQKYFRLDTVSRTHVDDFNKISKRLELFYPFTCFDDEMPILLDLKDTVLSIMKDKEVEESIILVANSLLENSGIIEGKALHTILEQISKNLINYSIDSKIAMLEEKHTFSKDLSNP